MKAGRYFGELALVSHIPRTATIQAVTRFVCLAITQSNFESFFSSNPQAYADFSIKLTRYSVPLQTVFEHPLGRDYFRQHCEGEYSTENLQFYDAVCEWEQMQKSGDRIEEVQKRAEEIMKTFIESSAEQQVNIPASCRQAVISRYEKEQYDEHLFEDAKQEILSLMTRDSYPRFKAEGAFRELLERVGGYYDRELSPEEVKLELEMEQEKQRQMFPERDRDEKDGGGGGANHDRGTSRNKVHSRRSFTSRSQHGSIISSPNRGSVSKQPSTTVNSPKFSFVGTSMAFSAPTPKFAPLSLPAYKIQNSSFTKK